MFRNFLNGRFGKILQIVFLIGGPLLFFGGAFTGFGAVIVIGIVLLCMGIGMRIASE